MIEKIIDLSIKNKFLVILMTVFVIAAGIYAMLKTPLDAIPDLSDVQVIIFTEYSGQAPQVVEDQVTYPLTTAMLSVPFAKVVRGYSFFGLSFVYVIFEDGKSRIFDSSKADYIKNYFKGKKIGLFYKFKAEYDCLKSVFGDQLTNDLKEFNETGKNIALQIVSGSEGISLKEADYLVYFNIDFSSKNYWQSRDRLTTMQRKSNDVFWVFAENGIEEKIYTKVLQKKSYTLNVFKKDFVYLST